MKRREFINKVGLAACMAGVFSRTSIAQEIMFTNGYDEEKCKEEWRKLVQKGAKKECFRYVGPTEGLPNVLLYGDSISMFYTETVRSELKNLASVFRVHGNGGPTTRVIKLMEQMKKAMFQPYLEGGWDFDWDLIHFNVGLHDLKRLYNNEYDTERGTQVSTPEQYKKNLIEIIKYFKQNYPKAKLIYALTTPVPKDSKGRKEGDGKLFNDAALEVMKNYPEIQINDLYALTKPNLYNWILGPGNVHFNESGIAEQGKQVARIIKDNLAK